MRSSHYGPRDPDGQVLRRHVLIDADQQPCIVDFAHAETTTRGPALDNDTAEFLVTTALIVGVDRAVSAAYRAIGIDLVDRAVPELQPLVLTAETRDRLRQDGDILAQLRAHITALTKDPPHAAPAPAPVRHGRTLAVVSTWSLVFLTLTVIAGDSVLDELANIRWRWIGLATVALAVTTAARGSSLLAALDRRLALGRTIVVRVVEQARDTTVGQIHGRDLLVDHLERSGVSASESQLALRRLRTVRWAVLAVSMLATIAAAGAAGAELTMPERTAWIALVGLVALVMELSVAHERRDGPRARVATRRRPRVLSMARLTLASVVEIAAGSVATASAIFAMGGGPPVASVVALHVVLAALTTAAPMRATPGLATAALVGGLAALGRALPQAVAAALAVQVLYAWLPAATGWALRRTGAL